MPVSSAARSVQQPWQAEYDALVRDAIDADLTPEHQARVRAWGLNDDALYGGATSDYCIYRSISVESPQFSGGQEISGREFLNRGHFSRRANLPGIVHLLHSLEERCVGTIFYPDVPREDDEGRLIEYELPIGLPVDPHASPAGEGYNALVDLTREFPSDNGASDPGVVNDTPLWITRPPWEADLLASRFYGGAVALPSWWAWRETETKAPRELWNHILWRRRPVFPVVRMGDLESKSDRAALTLLSHFIRQRGAVPRFITLDEPLPHLLDRLKESRR